MTKIQDTLNKWNALFPLQEEDDQRMRRKLMLDFNYNSNHIEGNELTYSQTESLLISGMVVGPAKMRDLEEMKAHNICLNMVEEAAIEKKPLTENFIRQIHAAMLREEYQVVREIPTGETISFSVHPGRYKTQPNSITAANGERFEFAQPSEVPALMTGLVSWYREAESAGRLNPIELAALFHYRYIRIHPFEDGNGRISRLMVNYILRSHGWPMLVVKTAAKKEYIEALRQVDRIIGNVPSMGAHISLVHAQPFIDFMTDLLINDVDEIIEFLEVDKNRVCRFQGETVNFKTDTPVKILRYLTENPDASLTELADATGVNRSAIQKQVDNLAAKGYIVRPEGKKRGWTVLAKCSPK